MPKLADATADQTKPDADKAKVAPKTVLVLDTTATPESGPRKHEQLIKGALKTFTFEPGKGLEMASEIAVKFLRHPGFELVDEKGDVLEYQRRPKQPDELGAGETIKLAENETIARFDELSTAALLQRVLEMPGGEKFAPHDKKPDRPAIIAFIKKEAAAKARANASTEADIGKDEFVPTAFDEDEAA